MLTAATNVLALAGSFYLLTVYDFVVPVQSVPLLIGLSCGVTALHVTHGLLDVLRGRLLGAGAAAYHKALRDDAFAAIQILPLKVRHLRDPLLPVRDLDQVRAFVSSGGAAALLDLPWMPAYLVAILVLSLPLGLLALGAVAAAGSLAIAGGAMTARANQEAARRGTMRLDLCAAVARNVDVARPPRPGTALEDQWSALSDAHATQQRIALDVAGAFSGAAKALRMIAQSGILGFGVYLLMRAEISAGEMMAASVLLSRALAPIDAASAHWRGLLSAQQSHRRLAALVAALEAERALSRVTQAPWASSAKIA